jgi:transcriptional regulator with XRE-family HTH domain
VTTLGERLRTLRGQADLTLAQVADRAELSVSYIADIEHDRRVPRLDALQRIAAVFEQDAVTLLGGVTPYDGST